VVRVGHLGVPLRRHTEILPTAGTNRSKADQDGYLAQSQRMERTKRRHPPLRRQQRDVEGGTSVLSGSRSSQSDRCISVQGMLPLSVTFSEKVTVVYVDSYGVDHRRGPWMYMAARRKHFNRKINEMEHMLSPVLNDVHRLNIYMSRFHVSE
jgi:hypothetical protein